MPMRLSQFHLRTTKETPADAELVSHQLMLRAGMIRQSSAGIYSWLPLGLRVLKKVEQIVREEQDAIGGQEVTPAPGADAAPQMATGERAIFGLIFFQHKRQRLQ